MEPSPADGRMRWSKKVAILVVGALVLSVLLGYRVGNTSSHGPKHLRVESGRAVLHNTENWLTSFDTDEPGQQLAFRADSVASDSAIGFQDHGVPPCLEVGRRVPVRVGYTSIRFPSGRTMPVVQWVECPGG